jgi:hypothetical protein
MWLGGPGFELREHGERLLSFQKRSDRYRDSPSFPCSVPVITSVLRDLDGSRPFSTEIKNEWKSSL